ncbi:MAG: SDR family oxidoreductase [Chitinophagales bacterium]
MNSTPFHLTGKTVLITGGSSGIGKQCAIDCSRMGASVIITGRNEERLLQTLSLLSGVGHSNISCNLLFANDLERLVNEMPLLDGIVHCAGIVKPFPISFLTEEKINETLSTNFNTVAGLTASLFKAKKVNKGASIVFLSSISGQHPHKGGSMYAASKAAIEAFSKTVALEYASKNIRANCISPAMVKTPMFDDAVAGMSTASMDEHVGKYPLGVGYPEDIANAVIFLLSSASRWITGTNVVMDGGLLLDY